LRYLMMCLQGIGSRQVPVIACCILSLCLPLGDMGRFEQERCDFLCVRHSHYLTRPVVICRGALGVSIRGAMKRHGTALRALLSQHIQLPSRSVASVILPEQFPSGGNAGQSAPLHNHPAATAPSASAAAVAAAAAAAAAAASSPLAMAALGMAMSAHPYLSSTGMFVGLPAAMTLTTGQTEDVSAGMGDNRSGQDGAVAASAGGLRGGRRESSIVAQYSSDSVSVYVSVNVRE
jgi:hypothetical protein